MEEEQRSDPYLDGTSDDEKIALVGVFLMRRHEAGHRGKGATSVTACLKYFFSVELRSTSFLDAAVVKAARNACGMTPDELRAKKDADPMCNVKLPFGWPLLECMRARLWTGRGWEETNVIAKMTYLACVWGYDLGARVSEYTPKEGNSSDHCVRVHDLSFTYDEGNGPVHVLGGDPFFARARVEPHLILMVSECRVLPSSSKSKTVTKLKVIGFRSPEEKQFLHDIVSFLVNSRTTGREELFTHRTAAGRIRIIRGSTVREAVKITCDVNGLPRNMFSSHSLRKASMTDMRALGSTEEDMRDRGNFSLGSDVMNNTYDRATGKGPLACRVLEGGYIPDVENIRKLIPLKKRKQCESNLGHLGIAG